MVIRLLTSMSLFLAVSTPCVAGDLYSADYSTCLDKSGGVTVEMLNCIAAEANAQDIRLNKAYKQLGSKLSASRQEQLKSAQRLWVQYRDANCNFYADPDGGTSAAVTSSECFLRQTAERAKELETLRSGP